MVDFQMIPITEKLTKAFWLQITSVRRAVKYGVNYGHKNWCFRAQEKFVKKPSFIFKNYVLTQFFTGKSPETPPDHQIITLG